MHVNYGLWTEGWELSRNLPLDLAATAETVCEVGAGANPVLPPRDGYVLLDVSSGELAKANRGYTTIIADVSAPDFVPPREFDLVFSLLTAEHVADARRFHTNVRRMLRRGGVAMHFFPTLYSLPFVANLVIPERVSAPLLRQLIADRDPDGAHGKFPAQYRWCRGPSRRQFARLEGCGFSIETYHGYFGHTYFRRLGLQSSIERIARLLVLHPVPALTSFALVVMRAA